MNSFSYPGTNPIVTSNGTTNGILWTLDVGSYMPKAAVVLRAYNALELGVELYNGTQAPNSRDQAELGVKFTPPMVYNGKV